MLCQMDDVMIFESDKAQHDQRLTAVLKRLQAIRVTLNSEKCEFVKIRVKFLGHVIDPEGTEGIRPDPEKISAIVKMTVPRNIPKLRRFLGMVNQLGKFSSRISELTQPLRKLLSSKQSWTWGSSQEAFALVKTELTKPTLYSFYSADISSYSIQAILLLQVDDICKPVAYTCNKFSDCFSFQIDSVADLGGVGGVQMNPPLELVIVTFAVIMITSPVLATTADHTVSHLHL